MKQIIARLKAFLVDPKNSATCFLRLLYLTLLWYAGLLYYFSGSTTFLIIVTVCSAITTAITLSFEVNMIARVDTLLQVGIFFLSIFSCTLFAVCIFFLFGFNLPNWFVWALSGVISFVLAVIFSIPTFFSEGNRKLH